MNDRQLLDLCSHLFQEVLRPYFRPSPLRDLLGSDLGKLVEEFAWERDLFSRWMSLASPEDRPIMAYFLLTKFRINTIYGETMDEYVANGFMEADGIEDPEEASLYRKELFLSDVVQASALEEGTNAQRIEVAIDLLEKAQVTVPPELKWYKRSP